MIECVGGVALGHGGRVRSEAPHLSAVACSVIGERFGTAIGRSVSDARQLAGGIVAVGLGHVVFAGLRGAATGDVEGVMRGGEDFRALRVDDVGQLPGHVIRVPRSHTVVTREFGDLAESAVIVAGQRSAPAIVVDGRHTIAGIVIIAHFRAIWIREAGLTAEFVEAVANGH